MIKRYRRILLSCPILLLVLLYACKPGGDRYTNPQGYDLTQPEKFNMPESLLEISGIAFYHGDGSKLYAIQDEDGKLFRQNWGVKKQVNTKFAPKGDYEDLTMINDQVFVLKSSGAIYGFQLNDMQKLGKEQVQEYKGLIPKGEYEGIYADQQNGLLYVLCKECKVDKKSDDVSGYMLRFDPATKDLTSAGEFKLNTKALEKLGKSIKSALKPSALSQHPVSSDWYILSSVNKVLIIASPDWKIKEAHHLSPSVFNQPEGMTFDKENNLYIANEGDELSSGNVLKFLYKKTNK